MALGLLIRREYLPADDAIAEPPGWPLPPGTTFYAVSLGGRQVGVASVTVDTLPEGLRVDSRWTLDLAVPDHPALVRLSAQTDALLSRNLRLRSWETNLIAGDERTRVSGQVEGDTAVVLHTRSGAVAETLRVAFERAVALPLSVPSRIKYAKDFRRGRSYELPVLDPIDLSITPQRFTVQADSLFLIPDSATFDSAASAWVPAHLDSVRAWRVEGIERGLPMTRWVDNHGLLVSRSTPLGMTLQRLAFELAVTNFRARRVSRATRRPLTNLMAGPPPLGRLPSTRSAGGLAIRIALTSGAPVVPHELPLGGTAQRWLGDTLLALPVESLAPALVAGYQLPADPVKFREYLRPEPLIQVDDPRILQATGMVLGGETDPRRAAERIGNWIRTTIVEEGSDLGSAVHALESRKGSPRSRLNLFVAMARAADLPTRTVGGVVRVKGRFYYQAWAEVLLGEWIPADPSRAGVPPDAEHLRFVRGSGASLIDLVPWIGQLWINPQTLPGTP